MPSSPPVRSHELHPEQFREDIHAFAQTSAILITIVMLLNLWGQWSTFLQVLLTSTVLAVINIGVDGWFTRRNTQPVAESVRVLVNALGFMVNGHITHWLHVLWFYVPFCLLWYSAVDRWVRVRLGAFLTGVTAFALWDGADPNVALTFVLLGIFSYLLTEKRMTLLRSLQQEVIAQREQLHVAYQRAMEQEKLSSLGVMAAGVAHEINNPMSFVTSNVHSLYRELKEHPSLPKPFQEYVDDVLPATLDGSRRINAIVSDLRRFARGDAESYVEFDLNTEVQAALRIAYNQLSHCHVETELGEVGQLTGRPQQIAQAVVNVLVNAGQASPRICRASRVSPSAPAPRRRLPRSPLSRHSDGLRGFALWTHSGTCGITLWRAPLAMLAGVKQGEPACMMSSSSGPAVVVLPRPCSRPGEVCAYC
jgi:two-component system NtrC family sensor kinase